MMTCSSMFSPNLNSWGLASCPFKIACIWGQPILWPINQRKYYFLLMPEFVVKCMCVCVHARECVCVCVCVRARARLCVCICDIEQTVQWADSNQCWLCQCGCSNGVVAGEHKTTCMRVQTHSHTHSRAHTYSHMCTHTLAHTPYTYKNDTYTCGTQRQKYV